MSVVALKAPEGKNANNWADFAELRCLIAKDRRVSVYDLLDTRNDLKDERTGVDDLDDADTDDAGQTAPTLPTTDEERAHGWLGDVVAVLEYRANAFGTDYPFHVDQHVLTWSRSRFTNANRVYLFLLLASNLNMVSGKAGQELTEAFEEMSLAALRYYLPEPANLHRFGGGNGRYRGTRFQKVKKLCGDVGWQHTENEELANPHNTGDGGLDVMGWFPFEDSAMGVLSIFVQCACGDTWKKKQAEAMPQMWAGRINFRPVQPVVMCCIPRSLRTSTGAWESETEIVSIIVDRFRLVHLLRRGGHVRFSNMPVCVEGAVTQRELVT